MKYFGYRWEGLWSQEIYAEVFMANCQDTCNLLSNVSTKKQYVYKEII